MITQHSILTPHHLTLAKQVSEAAQQINFCPSPGLARFVICLSDSHHQHTHSTMEPPPPPSQAQQEQVPAATASGGVTAPQQQPHHTQQQHPPTHKPLTHNPPLGTSATTAAPWASSPATGSPFPQLARPADNAVGVISSSGRADRMSPTAAPWVAAAPPRPLAAGGGGAGLGAGVGAAAGGRGLGAPSSQLLTGRPVAGGSFC